ncbi:MAG: hypothetical protein AAB630_03010, partial [Patescibacteria group bacterium]
MTWRIAKGEFALMTAASVLWIAGAMLAFLVLYILSVFLLAPRETTAVSGAYLVGFLLMMGGGYHYGLAAVLAFLLFFYAASLMRGQISNRLKPSFYPLTFYGTPAAVTSFAVLFAFVGYFYPFHFNSLALPPALFRYATPVVEPLIASQAPWYKKGMTVDEFLSASMMNSISAEQAGLIATNKKIQTALASEVGKQRDAFGEQFGITLHGGEQFQDFLALVADSYISRYLTSYQAFIPIIVALSAFLAVKSVGFLFSRAAVLGAWLIMKMLLAFGVVERKTETVE